MSNRLHISICQRLTSLQIGCIVRCIRAFHSLQAKYRLPNAPFGWAWIVWRRALVAISILHVCTSLAVFANSHSRNNISVFLDIRRIKKSLADTVCPMSIESKSTAGGVKNICQIKRDVYDFLRWHSLASFHRDLCDAKTNNQLSLFSWQADDFSVNHNAETNSIRESAWAKLAFLKWS